MASDGERLYDAAGAGNEAEVNKLIGQGVKWDSWKTAWGATSLHFAAFKGFPDVIKSLLNAKADVKAATNDGRTPLHYAASNGHASSVRLLLDANADPMATTKDGNTALHYVAQYGRFDAFTIRALVRAGADPDARNKKGESPRMYAAKMNKTIDFEWAVKKGLALRAA